jgi:predicted AAA+ superfamily ATPase
MDDIRFWRTQNKNEVDFIVNEKHAIEVKTNMQSFDPRKYALFMENYPDIPLECIDLEASLDILNPL